MSAMSDREDSTTPPAAPRPARGRRILRWPTRILAVVGVVAVGLVLVQVFVLPRVVGIIVHRALVDFGFKNVSFNVQNVSFVHMRIADFRLDGEAVNTVGGITADYTIKTLLDGRITALRVERAEIQVTIEKDGSVDVGPLDLSAGDTSKKESQQAPSDGRLPFDRLEVVDSILNIAWEERRFAVPVRGTVWDLGQRKSSVELVATLYNAPLRVNGTLDASGETMEISATGSNWRIGDVLASIPERLTEAVPQLAGEMDVEASYRRDGKES